jgi:hypothetical protein
MRAELLGLALAAGTLWASSINGAAEERRLVISRTERRWLTPRQGNCSALASRSWQFY